MRLKVSSAKWRPFCHGLNVLRHCGLIYVLSVNTMLLKGVDDEMLLAGTSAAYIHDLWSFVKSKHNHVWRTAKQKLKNIWQGDIYSRLWINTTSWKNCAVFVGFFLKDKRFAPTSSAPQQTVFTGLQHEKRTTQLLCIYEVVKYCQHFVDKFCLDFSWEKGFRARIVVSSKMTSSEQTAGWLWRLVYLNPHIIFRHISWI